MKKISLLVLSLSVALASGASAQESVKPGTNVTASAPQPTSVFAPNAIITEGFATVSGAVGSPLCALAANLTTAGWFAKNNAAPVGTSCVFNGGAGTTFPAQAGAATEYAAMNFNNSTGTGAISTWFVTPRVNFGTGAKLEFWTRAAGSFADRLEVRTSVAADTGTPDVGTTLTDVGTFTNLALTINPALTITDIACPATSFTAAGSTLGGYPNTAWCKVTIEGAALPSSGSGRIAFRYQVTNGGPSGANSNFIGIDTFSFDEGTTGPAAVVTAVTAPGAISLTRTLPTSTSTSALVFNTTGGPTTMTCATSSAGYSVAPAPLNLVVGTPGTVTVTHTGTTAGSFAGVVTCTAGAGATGGPFVYNFTTNVLAATPIVQAPTLNVWGAMMLLAGIGLFGAFAVRRFS